MNIYALKDVSMWWHNILYFLLQKQINREHNYRVGGPYLDFQRKHKPSSINQKPPRARVSWDPLSALLNSQFENPWLPEMWPLSLAYSLSSSMQRTKAWKRRKMTSGTVILWMMTQLLCPYTLRERRGEEISRGGQTQIPQESQFPFYWVNSLILFKESRLSNSCF